MVSIQLCLVHEAFVHTELVFIDSKIEILIFHIQFLLFLGHFKNKYSDPFLEKTMDRYSLWLARIIIHHRQTLIWTTLTPQHFYVPMILHFDSLKFSSIIIHKCWMSDPRTDSHLRSSTVHSLWLPHCPSCNVMISLGIVLFVQNRKMKIFKQKTTQIEPNKSEEIFV